MEKAKKIIPLFLIIAAALFASWPLFGQRYIPTHDGEYHIIRFMEFWKMLSSGYFFPRWAPTLNSGYGLPLFNFHYPLPNYIGSFWHLWGFDFVTSFKLVLASGYILSGVFCYFWLKKLWGNFAAWCGTLVMLYTPYFFVDTYVRGVIGEVWAIVFIFASLTTIEYKKFTLLSLCIAGLILSHNILALLFLPFIIGYVFIKSVSWRIKIKNYWPVLIGLGLSTYFWLPAITERHYMLGLNTVNYRDHFAEIYELLIPSWGTGFSAANIAGKMSFQIGIIPLLSVLFIAWLLLQKKIKTYGCLVKYFLLIFVLAIFLTLAISQPVWELLPILQYVQYPWRFLSFVIIVAPLFIAAVAQRWFIFFLPIMAVILTWSYSRPVVYSPRDDNYYLSRQNFTDGTSSMGNSFTTIWTPWKKERAKEPVSIISGQGKVFLEKNQYLRKEIQVKAITPIGIEVNTLYYPGWTVLTGSNIIPIDYKTSGTIRFSLPAGENSVTVVFKETPIRLLADLISLISLAFLILINAIIKKRKFLIFNF